MITYLQEWEAPVKTTHPDFGSFELRFKDPMEVLKNLFAKKELAQFIALSSRKDFNEKGQRVYSEACTGLDFQDFEVYLSN
jgi:hypothetical protein